MASDKEINAEIKKLAATLKGLADSWAKTGMPTNIEEAAKEVEQFIAYIEKVRPDVKKKRKELLRKFPQLKDLEGL